MSASAPAAHAEAHGPAHYTKIWGILLGLLVVSVAGPFLGIPIVTLLTAFGIALVKAYLVAKHFMHLPLERKYVTYLLVTMLALMGLMVGALSPDILRHQGRNWENVAAKRAVEQGQHAAEHGQHAAPTH